MLYCEQKAAQTRTGGATAERITTRRPHRGNFRTECSPTIPATGSSPHKETIPAQGTRTGGPHKGPHKAPTQGDLNKSPHRGRTAAAQGPHRGPHRGPDSGPHRDPAQGGPRTGAPHKGTRTRRTGELALFTEA